MHTAGAVLVPKTNAHLEILGGWKEIANYLGKGVRTVQRYERELGLPVCRPGGGVRGSVIATKAEIDGWVAASPLQNAFQLPRPSVDTAGLLKELKRYMRASRKIRRETAELRGEVNKSLERLHTSLGSLRSREEQLREPGTDRGAVTDVVMFDPKKKKVQ